MKRRSLLALAVVASVAAILGGFVWSRQGRSAAAPASPAVPVIAGVAKAQDVPAIIQALGTVQPVETVAVQSRVSGQVLDTYFTPGKPVKQGQPLFLIDPRPYQAALQQARGQLAKDQASLQQAQADLARYQRLAKEDSISKQQTEDQAFVVKQDQGTVTLDQANIANAQLNLGYCHIDAPVGGLAGPRLVDPGNNVAAGAGTTLVTITQVQPIHVNFSIPQTALTDVRRYEAQGPLAVDAYAQSGKQIAAGTLSLIDNQVNAATGTVLLQATFPNADEALWPGAFVSTRLVVHMRHDAITVPDSTVMVGPTGPYVYVIQPDDTVKRAAVKVATRQDGIAVISKGVAAGARIVTSGQFRLADGVKVAIQATANGNGTAANIANNAEQNASGS